MALFFESHDYSQRTGSFAASLLIHCSVFALLSFAILTEPPIVYDATNELYSVRHLNLHSQTAQLRLPPAAADVGQGNKSLSADVESASHRIATQLEGLSQVGVNSGIDLETPLQLDMSSHAALIHKIEIPTFVIWQHGKVPVKMIVAKLLGTPISVAVTSSFNAPTEELYQQDLGISALDLRAQMDSFVAGTTSPVMVHEAESGRTAPSTISRDSSQPTPVATESLSILRMPDAVKRVPPFNETAAYKTSVLTPDWGDDLLQEDIGRSGGKPGDRHGRHTSIHSLPRQEPGAHKGQHLGSCGSTAGHQASALSATPINLSKAGRFGSVVVGASLADQFPDIEALWNDRLAYTAYLHVGLAQSWILQFSLPESAEAAGNTVRLEAPWPYSIMRPDLAPAATLSNALIFRGFINLDGRFEMLTSVFPPSFPEAQFVVDCLQEWHFRPATQVGRATRVEVLLIIPQPEQ